MPCALRFSDPAQITSSLLRIRSERPCSPSAQRSASARFDLPDSLGPTTALMPGPNSTSVRSANDLKPWTLSPSRRAGAFTSLPIVGGIRGRVVGEHGLLLARGAGGGRRGPGGACREPFRLQHLERLGGRRGLRDPPRRPLARAE